MSKDQTKTPRGPKRRPPAREDPANEVLQGKREICRVLRRSWPTVAGWVKLGAPVALIQGAWEADRRDLIEWRRAFIRQKISQDSGL